MEFFKKAMSIMPTQESPTGNDISITALVINCLSSLLIFILLYPFLFGAYSRETPEKLGQIGDFVGGILNPVLSFCAFIILINTFKQQKKDSKEIKKNHDEALGTQRFLGLISLTHESARGVEIEFPTEFKKLRELRELKNDDVCEKKTLQNHLAIGHAWRELKSELPRLHKDKNKNNYETAYYYRMTVYRAWRNSAWQWIGSYFETILFVLQKYSIPEGAADSRKDDYHTRAVRHQMTTSERNILFHEMLGSEVYHKHMRQLHSHYFWRGGGDGLDEHRLDLIAQAEAHFKNLEISAQKPA